MIRENRTYQDGFGFFRQLEHSHIFFGDKVLVVHNLNTLKNINPTATFSVERKFPFSFFFLFFLFLPQVIMGNNKTGFYTVLEN